GFYGPPEGLLAVNALAPADRLIGLDYTPLNARLEAYQVGEPQDLRGPVLLAALGLLALDALVVFLLAGGIGQIFRPAPPSDPLSSGDADFAMKATTDTRLAYVITGDAEVDGISKSGLQGLTLYL